MYSFNRQFFKHEGTAKLTHPLHDGSCESIVKQLRTRIDDTASGQWLEIASGSGEHMAYFAPLFPNITFQPSDFDRNVFDSIAAYANNCPTQNMLRPIFIDTSKDPSEWINPVPFQSLTYMYNCNLTNATPWECCEGLFRAAGKLLKSGGKLFMYGLFPVDTEWEPELKLNEGMSFKVTYGDLTGMAEAKRIAALNEIKLSEVVRVQGAFYFLVWTKI